MLRRTDAAERALDAVATRAAVALIATLPRSGLSSTDPGRHTLLLTGDWASEMDKSAKI